MPASNIKRHVFTSMLLATMVLSISPPGHTADKAPYVGKTLDGKECIRLRSVFGPFDYLRRAQFSTELDVVENAHFTANVERLESGNTAAPIDDIAYTIGAWPNHHRALHSAMRYRMMVWDWPKNSQTPPAECQLQRAIQFSPQDPVPYMLYGLLLHRAQKYDEALVSFRAANRLNPDDVLTLYNMGLTLVELKQYEEAVQKAKSAYAAGIPLPGLKNKLIAAGQWPEAVKSTGAPKAAPDAQLKTPAEPAEKTTPKAEPKAELKVEPKVEPKETKPLAIGDKQGVEPPVASE